MYERANEADSETESKETRLESTFLVFLSRLLLVVILDALMPDLLHQVTTLLENLGKEID